KIPFFLLHIGSSYAIIGVDTLLTYLILTILIIITTRNFCVSRTAKTPRFGHGVLALFDAWQCPTLAW
ncbi:hypothetical protein O3J21_20910, partial [Yersinia pestis]|uniref:hypothetical protein n=1 Tax=Yersinia pestis TaxID=632 RepID=UPI001C4C1AF2